MAGWLGLAAASLGLAILLSRTTAGTLDEVLAFALRGVRVPTAVALVVGGLAFVGLERTRRPWLRRACSVAAAAMAALGLAALATSWTEPAHQFESVPIAIGLVLVGLATPFAAMRPHDSRTVQLAGGAAFVISLLVLLGRAYSARPFYEVGGPMPARTGAALGLLLLALALLLARPQYVLPRLFAGRSLGADHLRRSLPFLLSVPLVTGVVALFGMRAGWYGDNVAFAVFTLLAMAVLALLAAISARRIDALATERTALEGLFARTFEVAAVGVARLDPEGRWLYVNGCLCQILDWPREELLGRGSREITHDEDRAEDESVMAAFARGEIDSHHLEKRFLTKQGEPVWVDLSMSAERGRDGGVAYYIAMVHDIRARKRAERAKDEFFALVSHELRSPLHLLGSWLAVLRRENAPEVRERAIAVAEHSAATLNRLIGDLLDASRIASGKLEIEREVFDLLEVVQGVVTAFEPDARARDVALALELPGRVPFVAGDPERIEQVARNLLDNALKFTPLGGRVVVRVTHERDHAALVVSDSGQGIPAPLLPHLFERFAQGEGGPRGSSRGLGLGLAIVRHLVDLHGGRIEARSEGPGRGAAFEVTLPVTEMPPRLAALSPATESDALDEIAVLLVKPDRSVAEAEALGLEASGASVAWATSSEQALELTRAHRPRVVVVDLEAGEEPEWGAWLRALREDGPAIAAIGLSASDHLAARRQARDAGFDACLRRPVDPQRLVAAIHALLHGPRRLLVVDDDRDAADSLAILLARRGFVVERAYGVEDARRAAARFAPAVVLTDLQLGNGDGIALARELRANGLAGVRIIGTSGRALEELAPDEGALFDGFCCKPVDLDALLALLRADG